MAINTFSQYLKEAKELSGVYSFSQWLVESMNPQLIAIRAKVASIPDQQALDMAEKIMELAKLKLFNHYPMFRPFLRVMPPIPKVGAGDVGPDGIGTMHTTGAGIFYDPKFVIVTFELGKLNLRPKNISSTEEWPKKGDAFQAAREGRAWPSDYALFVLIHEILHNSLKHFMRTPPPSTKLSVPQLLELWNISTDFEINHILKGELRDGLAVMMPGGVDADDPKWKVPEEDKEFFKTASAERIMIRLIENIEAKMQEEEGGDGEDEEEKEEEGNEGDKEKGEDEGEGGEDQNEEGDDQGEGDKEGGNGEKEGDGNGGENGENDSESELKVGDVIYDSASGSYGVVKSVSGEDIEFDQISEEDAMARLK